LIRNPMTDRLQYGNTAKLLHWLVVALLLVQYPLGWLMPDIHRGMKPGAGMTFHISFGILMLLLIVLRFAWRLTHPVAPERSLPRWYWPRPSPAGYSHHSAAGASRSSIWCRYRCWLRRMRRPARLSTAGTRR